MNQQTLRRQIDLAREDDNFFTKLSTCQDDFDGRVLDALGGMDAGRAMSELMTAPTVNHCPSTSCGISSMISDED